MKKFSPVKVANLLHEKKWDGTRGMCATHLVGKVKEKSGKKEEPAQHTNQQMQSCKGEKIMEAGDCRAFKEREQQRTFY